MPSIGVVIPAGGVGTRLGRRLPKQFLSLGGEPIIALTLRHFLRHPEDTRDWSTSPRTAGEKRGSSDRFALRFKKP